jgi:ubiquinone/menaquinone biosynthesis C-methylase UbiE
MDSLSSTQLANIEFHRLLAAQYEQQPFFQEHNRSRVQSLLQELAKSTAAERLLDIGCGTGFILDLAHDIFKKVDGIDITSEMLQKVRQRPNLTTQLASAEELPFPDETFDAVTAYSVLHHLDDLTRVFREVRRTLRRGGFFYADESPSQHYFDALLSLDSNSAMSEPVRRERERLVADASKYKKFGLSVEIVHGAMVQNYRCHSLRQENLERLLRSAGFDFVQITFRRFIGEDQCRETGGEERVSTLNSYLTNMLPLSRSLFKYFVLVAR